MPIPTRATKFPMRGTSPQCSDNYEEFIGAKKHLVTGLSAHTGRQGSNPFSSGSEEEQWWKRSSGDGVAMSAGIISPVDGK
jgi:hypothetical protein